MSTPPRKGTTSPGRVTTMTCQLTATVECVADMMYQLTPMKFMPLPNSDTNIAAKKKRNDRCPSSSRQSTRGLGAVAMESNSLLLKRIRTAANYAGGKQPRGLHFQEESKILKSRAQSAVFLEGSKGLSYMGMVLSSKTLPESVPLRVLNKLSRVGPEFKIAFFFVLAEPLAFP